MLVLSILLAATAGFAIWVATRHARALAHHRRADLAHRVEKAHLEQLFEGAPAAVVLLDNAGYILRVNSEFVRLFGYQPDEVVGQALDDLLAPEERRGEAQELTRRVAEGDRVAHETVRRRKDGSLVQVSILGTPIYVEGGQVAVYGMYRDITARKRAEEELERSLSLLRATLESTADGILVVDNDGRIVSYNRKLVDMWGIPDPVIDSRDDARVLDFVLDQLKDPEGFLTKVRALYRDPGAESYDTIQFKDGRVFERFSQPQRVAGKTIGRVWSFRDVTERVRVEEALRVSEEKFSKAFRASPDIVTLSTIEDGVLLDVNDTFERVTGYSRAEVVGRSVLDLNLWVNLADRERLVRQLRERGVARNLELEFRTRSGDIRIGLLSAEVIEVAGHPCMLTVSNDITERKEAERALLQSEERYALAARGANDGLWDWDLKTNEIYYSPRWKTMLGYGEAEIGASPDEWLTRVHRADIERVRAAIAAHLDGQAAHFECEYRMLCKDGTFRWMLARGLAVRDQDHAAYRMAGSQTDITARKSAEERLLHEAIHDVLTGLPNRALFMDLLARSVARAKRRRGYMFAVLFLDLDRFKVINDSLGHLIGDRLLVALAGRLAKCLRPEDTVARLGGDEFTVLLEDINDVSDATRVAERIHKELDAPFRLDGHEIYSTVSIGIALSATGYDEPDHILRDADTAMYRAKALGKARHEVFDQAMHTRAVALLRLETDLRRAIERNEFRVFYQPIYCLQDGTIQACEALVRWEHPHRGLIYPPEFVPVAEETGLILPIGQWVLWEACRQLREWQQRFRLDGSLCVSVNLSNKQFSQPDLVEKVKRVLEDTGLEPQALKLEITESVIMEHGEGVTRVLKKLKELGIDFYIDDFGTGYSSFSSLHRFPINALKIDGSFVRQLKSNEDGSEIVRTIMTLARNLELQVIAEGVETKQQAAQLKALKCDFAQGSYFADATDPASLERLLARQYG